MFYLTNLISSDYDVYGICSQFLVLGQPPRLVSLNEHIPHGIKYSLTLHNQSNIRILGYDNAHGIKPKRKKYGAKRITWDHKHERKTVEPYEFETPAQLLEDFWTDVERIMIENKG